MTAGQANSQTQRNLTIILLLTLLVSEGISVQAQLGVGVKVPPWMPSIAYVSYMLSEHQMLEGSVLLQSWGSDSLIRVSGSGKLFLDAVELGTLTVHPFLGAGVSIGRLSMSILGQTASVMVLSINVLVGMEYRIPNSPVSLLGEIGHGISLSPPGVGMGGALGLRYEL